MAEQDQVPGLPPDKHKANAPYLPTEQAAPPTTQSGSPSVPVQNPTAIFVPDPDHADLVICQICHKALRLHSRNAHSKTKKHKRLAAQGPEPAKEPQRYCEVCQRSVRQSYFEQHEGTDAHQQRLESASDSDLEAYYEAEDRVQREVPEHKKTHDWTLEEDDMIMMAWDDMKDDEDIALLLPHRGRTAVKRRREYLTNPHPTAWGTWELPERREMVWKYREAQLERGG